MRRAEIGVMSACLLFVGTASAAAQELPVSRLLPEMVKAAAVVGNGEHREHFLPGLADAAAIHDVNRVLLFQAASFPLGPTGAVIAAHPEPGTPRLFGAGYTDTAFSLGRRRLLVNLGYQSTTFDSIDGLDLRASDLTLYVPHPNITGDDSDRDLLQQTVSMRVRRKVGTVAFTYGLSSRVDVGVVVPFVQMTADVRVLTQILRTGSAATPNVHSFNILDGGSAAIARYCREDSTPVDCHGRSSARGIGDIVLRGRAALIQGAGALAVTFDARLPTGNAEDLIGLGATQITPAVVWSQRAGRVGVRARAEYTWSSGTLTDRLADDAPGVDLDVPDAIGGGVGLDADVLRHTTLSFDVFGRQVTGLRQFSRGTVTYPSRGPGPLPSAPFVATDALLAGAARDVTQIMATIGLRVDLSAGFVAQVHALIPVGNDGVRPQPGAVVSLTKRY